MHVALQPRLAIAMILAGCPEGALVVLGIECSSFVAINKGTHKRDWLMPFGDTTMPSVADANKGTSRRGFLLQQSPPAWVKQPQ